MIRPGAIAGVLLTLPNVLAAQDCDGQTVLTVKANGYHHDVVTSPNCLGPSSSGWLLAAAANEMADQMVRDNPNRIKDEILAAMLREFLFSLENEN